MMDSKMDEGWMKDVWLMRSQAHLNLIQDNWTYDLQHWEIK